MMNARGNVTIITTGGTTDKDCGQGLGVRDLEVGPPFAPGFLERMSGTAITFQPKILLRKDSMDMTDLDRSKVVRACKRANTSKIIVTHGTDSMIKTAECIHNSGIGRRRTIVLTGALRPQAMRVTDAEFHLGLALGACLLLESGIWIAMNGIHAWNQCTKHPKTGVFMPT